MLNGLFLKMELKKELMIYLLVILKKVTFMMMMVYLLVVVKGSFITLNSFTWEISSQDLDVSTSEPLEFYLGSDLEKYMHTLIAQACISSIAINSSGVSSHPPINKRRRNHKTFYMH